MLKCVGRPVPPHPGPLPEERVKHRPTIEHCQDIRFADRLATILPLPACRAVASSRRPGERAGVGGNGSSQATSAFEMKDPCKVQCPLPLSYVDGRNWRLASHPAA